MGYICTQILVFSNTQGDTFKLTGGVVTEMSAYIQDHPNKTEAGGILLGRYIKGCADIIVDQVTTPNQHDHRERTRFFRAKRYHQQVIDQVWLQSKGTCNYLGEWHTHPEPDPAPSLRDILGWRKHFLFDRIDSTVLHFVILGTLQINVWQIQRNGLAVEKLCRL